MKNVSRLTKKQTYRLIKGVAALVLLAVFTLLRPSVIQTLGQSSEQAGQSFVKRVLDGDTVVLSDGERVRYIGVDTPEVYHSQRPNRPEQWYAREAKAFNSRLVEGKPVKLEFDVERRDKYKRLLAYVYLEDGTFVNAELVRQGYARILTIPPNVKYADLFLKYEREARQASRGLWGQEMKKKGAGGMRQKR